MSTPHYVRFARSLALLGGLGAMGCPESNTGNDAATPPSPDAFSIADAPVAPGEDAPVALADAFSAEDAPVPTDDAFDICTSCVCTGFAPDDAGIDAGAPDCLSVPGAEICCAAVGPLLPPDLAA